MLVGAGSAGFEVAAVDPPKVKRFVAAGAPLATVVVAENPNGLGRSAAVVVATSAGGLNAFPKLFSGFPKMPVLAGSGLVATG